ncbi:MAG TPA: PilN domain-containing protein [Vicinamibacterales bacterium]|nr:PilN domain-containing protein [Vicinamibacterales bacterium]
MIRINLVAGERRAAKPAGRSFQIGQKITVAGSLILLLTLLLLGWRYWVTDQHEKQLAADIEAARREESRLAEVLRQVTEFEAQRSQLQQRVTLIDELRKGQTAPVHMVDQISRSLPEMTWLTKLTQEGYNITIEGRCLSLTALSDFVGNLETTRYFSRPVEIVETEVMPGANKGPDLIRFTIKGTFQMAGIEQQAAAAKPRGAR